jgi:hypothetical protein
MRLPSATLHTASSQVELPRVVFSITPNVYGEKLRIRDYKSTTRTTTTSKPWFDDLQFCPGFQ